MATWRYLQLICSSDTTSASSLPLSISGLGQSLPKSADNVKDSELRRVLAAHMERLSVCMVRLRALFCHSIDVSSPAGEWEGRRAPATAELLKMRETRKPQASEFMAAVRHNASHLDRVPECFSMSGTCFLTKKLRRRFWAQDMNCPILEKRGFVRAVRVVMSRMKFSKKNLRWLSWRPHLDYWSMRCAWSQRNICPYSRRRGCSHPSCANSMPGI